MKLYSRMINIKRAKFLKRKKPTKPQKQFEALCKYYKLNYKRQYLVGSKYYDFYLVDYNILIQIDGKYWHGKDLKLQQKSIMQIKNSANDKYKDALAQKMGYKLYRFWQGEINIKCIEKILGDIKDGRQII